MFFIIEKMNAQTRDDNLFVKISVKVSSIPSITKINQVNES